MATGLLRGIVEASDLAPSMNESGHDLGEFYSGLRVVHSPGNHIRQPVNGFILLIRGHGELWVAEQIQDSCIPTVSG